MALLILIGAFYGLFFADTESRVIYGGLITMVGTYYFIHSTAKQATGNAIEAQNNGLDAIRQGVRRIEEDRTPTQEERTALQHK